MPKELCPHCQALLTEDERLSGQCPRCKTFFESQIPGAAYAPREPARQTRVAQAPVIRTSGTSRGDRQSGSGWGSSWWIIIVVVLCLRGFSALIRMDRDTQSSYQNDYHYEPPPHKYDGDNAELERLLQQLYKHDRVEELPPQRPGAKTDPSLSPWDDPRAWDEPQEPEY